MHRDIKPGNLLVAAGGTTKITDFGIATAVRAAQATHLTETGMVMGTAMYVSPEQATGAPVNDASDIYSLGVVAYECLAGHPPFTAREPLAIAFAHKHEPVPPLPPDVPPPVADLVYHMLAKTPLERPAGVRAVADRADMLRDALALGEDAGYAAATRADLPAAATGAMPGAAATESLTGRQPRPPGRRWRGVAAGATAGLCALAAAIGLYLSGHASGNTTGNVGSTSTQQPNSPSVTPSRHASQHAKPTPTLTPRVVAERPTTPSSLKTSLVPAESPKPTPTKKTSPSASASASASTSPTATSSPTGTSSATPSTTSTSS